MRQFQRRFQTDLLLATEQLHLSPVVSTADDGQGRDQENVLQSMQPDLGPTRIVDLGEQGNRGPRAVSTIGKPPERDKSPHPTHGRGHPNWNAIALLGQNGFEFQNHL